MKGAQTKLEEKKKKGVGTKTGRASTSYLTKLATTAESPSAADRLELVAGRRYTLKPAISVLAGAAATIPASTVRSTSLQDFSAGSVAPSVKDASAIIIDPAACFADTSALLVGAAREHASTAGHLHDRAR